MITAMLGPDRTLITGYPRFEFDKGRNLLFNSVGTMQGGQGLRHQYDKRHLVPFGEYLPLAELLGAIGLKKLTAGREGYSPGSGPLTFDVPGLEAIRPLICYEVIFPDEVTDGEIHQSGVLLNLTNDAWFGDSIGPHQHLAIARMRAIEQQVPLIRVANTGISGVFDPVGRLLSRLELNESGVIDTHLPISLRKVTPE